MIEVTALWCQYSDVEEGMDGGTHHLRPGRGQAMTCRYCLRTEADIRAEAETEATLRDTSTAGLLRAAYALTHRMHEAEHEQEAYPLRAQRDLITAEVIRRADPGLYR